MADGKDPAATPITYKSADYTEKYCNNLAVECRLLDFRLRFGLSVYPEAGDVSPFMVEFFQGIIISPTEARDLAALLAQEVRRYEECFGPIPMLKVEPPAPKIEEAAHAADPPVIN